MLSVFLQRTLQAWMGWLSQPRFREWVFGLMLFGAFLGTLLAVAVDRQDAFLRLKPLICPEGLADRQFFVVAMATPISVLLMLAAIGELWTQLENRRSGIPPRWFHVLLFFGLALGLAILVLLALGC